MRFDTWLTVSASRMDFKAITSFDGPGADFGGKLGHPTVFVSHADPEGRFVLRYPEGWFLESGPPVRVRSRRLPLGARVDVLSGPEAAWEAVRTAVAGPDGLLVGEKRFPGPPRQIRGQMVTPEALVEVRALAFSCGSVTIALTTEWAPLPNPGLERYGRAVLAAVRREFRVLPPAPPG